MVVVVGRMRTSLKQLNLLCAKKTYIVIISTFLKVIVLNVVHPQTHSFFTNFLNGGVYLNSSDRTVNPLIIHPILRSGFVSTPVTGEVMVTLVANWV